jgi:hypothetical protein
MKIALPVLALAAAAIGHAQLSTQARTAGPILGGPFDAAIVTGRPFTAQVLVESRQTLADGSHVVNQQTVTAARDSQGRTRREEVPATPGAVQQPKIVFISDPVAHTTYILGPDHVARKVQQVQRFSNSSAAGHTEPDAKTESLGTQTIAGVLVEGTGTTYTVPAGIAGNQNSLTILDERWYSKDLQITILSRHFDPRFGESYYGLTAIQQGEPPASLFQIPSDYTVEADRK